MTKYKYILQNFQFRYFCQMTIRKPINDKNDFNEWNNPVSMTKHNILCHKILMFFKFVNMAFLAA